jgi:hypothetical protein
MAKESFTIDENTIVKDLLQKCEKMEEFFKSKGLYCVSCKGAINCSLKKVAYYYGFLPLEKFLKEVESFYRKNCVKAKVVKVKHQS